MGLDAGRVHLWQEQQQQHWKVYKSHKSSRCWTTKLLKKLMGIVWDMWQHHNKVLHEAPDNWALILEVDLNLLVTDLYNLGPQAFAPSAALMKLMLPVLLRLPWAYKAHWVKTAHIAKAKRDRMKAGPYHQEWQYANMANLRLTCKGTKQLIETKYSCSTDWCRPDPSLTTINLSRIGINL